MIERKSAVILVAKIALIAAAVFVSSLYFTHLQNIVRAGQTSSNRAKELLNRQVMFGLYDPSNHFSSLAGMRIQHIFLQWNSFDKAVLNEAYRTAESANRILMVTVEPFTDAANWQDGREELFSSIASGKYDGLIDGICKALAGPMVPVLVRWGHEMDDDSGRYPWARNDPHGYVEAYRHFVKRCRNHLPEGQYIWSPTGLRNVESYYPGAGYVDFVGLSVYSLEAWDLDNLGRASRARDAISSRYNRVSRFNKPLIIAELGVAGSKEYVTRWLLDLHQQVEALPAIRAVVYFNDKEPYHWGSKYGSPDWRVTGDMLQILMRGVPQQALP